jgi:hypothetical protein
VVTRRQAVGLPVLAMVISFFIVLGLGRIATAEEGNGETPPRSEPTTSATPAPGVRVTVLPNEGQPTATANGRPPSAPTDPATDRIRLCVTPHRGWSLTDPAAGPEPSAAAGRSCYEIGPDTGPLDIRLEPKR